MQAIKFTADTQHRSSFRCSSCADWQKGSSSGKICFSDFTGITAEGSLEHTDHCMWEILYYKGQKDSCESNTVKIKLLSNHFNRKIDLACTSSTMSQRNRKRVVWYSHCGILLLLWILGAVSTWWHCTIPCCSPSLAIMLFLYWPYRKAERLEGTQYCTSTCTNSVTLNVAPTNPPSLV